MLQKDAIVRLLRDNDPTTVTLLKEQLIENGPDAVTDLKDLLTLDDAGVTAHVREVLDEIGVQQAHEEMMIFTHLFRENGDIEEACWLLARSLEPGLQAERYQRKLDAWGRRLTMVLSSATGANERLQCLTSFMSEELGFRGNSKEYYDPRNSLLNRVIDHRVGIPISLAVLYMAVARRAGLHVEGINLPGHFILRCNGIFFDPFHQGRILSMADCEAILARQKLKPQPAYFEPAPPRLIFTRMLANLLFIFERSGDTAMHKLVLGWLQALERKS